MAYLRNREVKILEIATNIDESTFLVQSVADGEKEYAKMHELAFTEEEANQFVRPFIPDIKIATKEHAEAVKAQEAPKEAPKSEVKKDKK